MWRLIAVCATWGVFWGSWSVLLPTIKDQIGATTADLGFALAGVPVGAIAAMALVGKLAAGRERTMLALSTCAFALSILLIPTARSPLVLGLFLLLLGATSGALDVTLNMATGRAERETGRRLFQPVHAAFPVAVIVTAPLTGLARELGLGPAILLGVIALLLLTTGLLVLGLPLSKGVPDTERGGVRLPWLGALSVGLLAACVLIIENSVEQWSVLLLEEYRDASTLLASAAPTAYMGALTVGRLLAQAFPRVNLRALYLISAFGGGGGIALAGLGPSAWISLTGFAVAGLALGPIFPAMLSRAATSGGAMVVAFSTISYTGFVISPLLVAVLSFWFGLPLAIALLGLLALPLLGHLLSTRSP